MKKLFNPKRLLKKRNSAGFTLIEMIVAVLLLGILVVGIMTFASPIFNMMKTNQKSARATMLAEAIDVYITGCLRYAVRAEVFTNADLVDAKDHGMADDSSGGMLNLTIFMQAGDNASKYEVRCLGITWMDEGSTNKKKLMLTNCLVDPDMGHKLKILDVQKVFDDSMYHNLYPRIEFSTFKLQDNTGAPLSDKANGYKITSKIFASPECYNVALGDAGRDATPESFKGATYVECFNMLKGDGSPYPASEVVKMFATTDGALTYRDMSRDYSEGSNTYYYPDTFIYYIVQK